MTFFSSLKAFRSISYSVLAYALSGIVLQGAAHAEAEEADSSNIIVTGTRNKSSTAGNSSIPIDVITSDTLSRSGDIDLRSALERVAPSVVHQNYTPVGGAFKDTITIHGLNANHVLVLVNGKRRHTSANISTYNGPQQSTTGVDLGFIPAGSIERIEILRDGDSANYGADALAGVVNIILKDASSGGLAQGTVGQFYEGDGFSRNITANAGFKLGREAFLNLSVDYSGRDHTTRTYQDATPPHRVPNHPATDKIALSYNAGIALANSVDLYSFGTYGHRGGRVLLSARGPTSIPAVHPQGYEPRQYINEDDFAVTLGIRARELAGWTIDLSSSFGANYGAFDLKNSANLGYFADYGTSPTEFDLYTVNSKQWTTTIDLSRELEAGFLAAPLTVALGGEFRREFFSVGGGDAASYYLTGSQGVPGLSPQNAVDADRTIFGVYAEISSRLTADWQFALSGRYENYSDTSNTAVGRVTTRYDISDAFAIRGTISTGFSAPSLGQQHFLNVSTGPASATGLLSPASAAAQSLGARALKPERSTSLSAGIVLRPAAGLNLTIDAYQISIDNRIIPGGTASGQAAADALRLAGFEILPTTPLNAVSASYLTNGADSRTRGVDVAADYLLDLGESGDIRWSLSANVNKTKLTSLATRADGSPVLNAQRVAWLTTATPKYKGVLSAEWALRPVSVLLRQNIYGPTTNQVTYYSGPNAFSVTNFHEFRQKRQFSTDIAVSYEPSDSLRVSVGANNLFDQYPDVLPVENQLFGILYDTSAAQLGLFGGYYYLSFRKTF